MKQLKYQHPGALAYVKDGHRMNETETAAYEISAGKSVE
jgi:hypothetical protein